MVCYPDCAAGLFRRSPESLPPSLPSTDISVDNLNASPKVIDHSSSWMCYDHDDAYRQAIMDSLAHEADMKKKAAAELEKQAKEKQGILSIITMSGRTIVALTVVDGELAMALKHRIKEKEGTMPQMQKLVQGGRILEDVDVVSKEPVVLVRIERKRAIVASSHYDLRIYDLETGEPMRVAPALNLRMTSVAADWRNLRCITGSANGLLRIWDLASGELIETLKGHNELVKSICVGPDNQLVAASKDGVLKLWQVYGGENDYPRVQTECTKDFLVSTDWSRLLALVAAEEMMVPPFDQEIVAYNLASGQRIWSFQVERAIIPALAVEWDMMQGLIAFHDGLMKFLPLEENAAMDKINKFGPRQVYHEGLMKVDWEESRVMVAVEPFALELWCMNKFELLRCIRDPTSDDGGMKVFSLDVDWTAAEPRAITCRTYIDWELVVGEVNIQHWDFREDGSVRNVVANHPMVGGFDIVDVMAQI